MKKKIADTILRLFKWKVTDSVGYIPKCVICVAPHTSNFDFLLGELAYLHLSRRASFLMKKSWFFFPLGNLLRAIGGFAVDRSKNNSLTQQIATEFARRKEFHIAITPEATRKPNSEWKKGFYFIAQAAGVPIVLASFDYRTRTIDISKIFIPSGDVDADIAEMKKTFANVTARHPERFVL